MDPERLEIELLDSLYEPGAPQERIFYTGSRPDNTGSTPGNLRYKVWLYLNGPGLPYVRTVTYTLHPTFPDPVRRVARTPSNPYCALTIWTWGLFNVRADVVDKAGHRHVLEHMMRYAQELKKDAHYERLELDLEASDS